MVRIDSYKLKDLRFELREAYGVVRAYPVDQEAFLFCRLTQTKTLTPWAIDELCGPTRSDHHEQPTMLTFFTITCLVTCCVVNVPSVSLLLLCAGISSLCLSSVL